MWNCWGQGGGRPQLWMIIHHNTLCMLWSLTLRYGEGNVVMLVLVENGSTYDQLTYRAMAFIFGYNTYWSCHSLLFLVTVWSSTLMTKARYTHDLGTVHSWYMCVYCTKGLVHSWPRYGTLMTKVRYTHDLGTVHSWPRYGTLMIHVCVLYQGSGTLMTGYTRPDLGHITWDTHNLRHTWPGTHNLGHT